MIPRKVFASVAEFQVYRVHQLAEKEAQVKKNKQQRAQKLREMREESKLKEAPVTEPGTVKPKQTIQQDSFSAGGKPCSTKKSKIIGTEKNKEKDQAKIAKIRKSKNRSLRDNEVQGTEIIPPVRAVSNTAVPILQTSANEISPKTRLERQFSSSMPKTWSRNGGLAMNPEPYQIVPRIRKAGNNMATKKADGDFGFCEEDAEIFAKIRTPEINKKRKLDVKESPLTLHGVTSAPKDYPAIADADSEDPRPSPMSLASTLQPQRHRIPAVKASKPDSIPKAREQKRQRRLDDYTSSSRTQSGPYIPLAFRLPHAK